jgi:hypothetical protein
MILGCAANFFCETVKFTQQSGNGNDLELYVSPWNYRTKGVFTVGDETFVRTTCQMYSSLEDDTGLRFSFDAVTRTVWSFSIIAPIIGGLLILFACLGPCTTVNPSRWKCLGYLLVFVCICQGLTLMVQSSSICDNNPVLQYFNAASPELADTFPESCEWATGYILNIVAVVCWLLAGVCAIFGPSPVVDPREPPQQQTVTYTQNADGTIQETNVTIVKGTAVPPKEKAQEMEA